MKKWIFISFSVLVVVVMLSIFFLQANISDEYYYKEKYKNIKQQCYDLEQQFKADYDDELLINYTVVLTRYKLNSGNEVVLLNKDDEVYYTSYFSFIGVDQESFENYAKTFIHQVLEEERTEKKGYYVNTINHIDEEYLFVVHEFETGEKIMVLSSIENTKEAIDIINKLLFRILIISCGVILILINILASKISKSLIALSNKTEELINLDFESEPIEATGPKEIRALGHSFNYLSKKLGETIKKLNRANEQLKKDMDIKVKQEEMRKQFISDVSHELKTPITIIKSHSEALIDGIGDSEYYLNSINAESGRMQVLIDELLEISKLESNNQELLLEEIDFYGLVHNNVKAFDAYASKVGKRLNFSADCKNGMIMADAIQLDKVVKNLIINGLKHSDTPDIDIRIVESKDSFKLSVYNKNAKIADVDTSKLWRRFYKVDKSRNRKKSGSGLGLAIVKMIIERHEGSYGMDKYDGGISIWIKLIK